MRNTPFVLPIHVWPNLLIVGLAIVSAGWAIAPERTLSGALALAAASAFAVYVAARFSVVEQLDLLRAALWVVALYTVLAVVVDPNGLALRSRGLYGWFTSKNHVGRCMSLSILAAIVASFDPSRRRMALVAGAVSCGLLIASDSRSAMIVIAVCWGGILLLCLAQSFPGWRRRLMAAAIAGAMAATFFVVHSAAIVFAWMGRDPTLSARTRLWRMLLKQWAQRPWLGFGYAAFWQGREGPSGEIAAKIGFYPWHSHNGFVELGLDLGAIGVVLFLVLLFVYSWRALRVGLSSRSRWALWPVAYLFYFVVSNLTETELVRHDSIYWVLYLIAAAHVGLIARTSDAGEIRV